MPFACFMMRSFFRELPDELIESATIDGAGKWEGVAVCYASADKTCSDFPADF